MTFYALASRPCHTPTMATKRPGRPRDPNQRAKLIVDMATGDAPRDLEPQPETPAIEARRKGGLRSTSVPSRRPRATC